MVDCRTQFDSYLIDSIIIYAKVSFNNPITTFAQNFRMNCFKINVTLKHRQVSR